MARVGQAATVVDLFSGAGGMSLGFHAAGFQIVGAADLDEAAAETFRTNFSRIQPGQPPEVLGGRLGDLEHISVDSLGCPIQPDIVLGSPPCQGFSRIGRGKLESLTGRGFEEDPRNRLYLRFVSAIATWKPRAFVMENVPGMMTVRGENQADRVAKDLETLGYRVGYALLNAVWYGVPQLRERLFFIGFRQDLGIEPAAPAATHIFEVPSGYIHRDRPENLSLPFVKDFRLVVDTSGAKRPAVSVEDALGDLPAITDHLDGRTLERRTGFRRPRKYENPPTSDFARLMRGWPGFDQTQSIDDHEVRRTPRDYETFRRMSPGDRYPEAVKIAWQRLEEECERLRAIGEPIEVASERYAAIVRRIVPPYAGAHDPTGTSEWKHEFRERWRKLIPCDPSWTLPAHLAKDSYSHIHYDSSQARMISVREGARLQSFPDAFRFSGNMGDCFRQIGNAVPPLMAAAVAEMVRDQLLQGRASGPCAARPKARMGAYNHGPSRV